MNRLILILCGLLLLVPGSLQAQGDYDNGNPPEPWLRYKVTVQAADASACYVSGSGQYVAGTNVTISSSAKSSNYTFSHWTKDGERIEQTASFTYTVTNEYPVFVAHYTYTPEDPSEPQTILQNRLYLTCTPEGACSFNRTSGAKVDYDTYVNVMAYASQGYVFQGWYNGEEKVCNDLSFNYLMPNQAVTLEARFVYDPSAPADPSTAEGQSNVQTHETGDANEDGQVDVSDAVAIINAYLNSDTSAVNANLSDANGDGVVDISDAVVIINKYLNGN